ncbi:hypothetical protein DF18_10155 [Streptomyces rimosus]|nr:hypothetical protein DF18_10155 [Streptomyces rimosus]
MIAPADAQAPSTSGLMWSWVAASSAELTRTISPGSGMPRLSRPMTNPTMRYTLTAGIVSSHSICKAASSN